MKIVAVQLFMGLGYSIPCCKLEDESRVHANPRDGMLLLLLVWHTPMRVWCRADFFRRHGPLVRRSLLSESVSDGQRRRPC